MTKPPRSRRIWPWSPRRIGMTKEDVWRCRKRSIARLFKTEMRSVRVFGVLCWNQGRIEERPCGRQWITRDGRVISTITP